MLLAAMLPTLFCGCTEGDEDGGPPLTAACDATPAGAGARVFLDCNSESGNMVSIDVIAADVTDEIDGYNIRLTFSPAAFRYTGFVSTAEPFMPACNALDGMLLCFDNSADANNSGVVIYTVTLTGSNPIGHVIGAGNQAVLGTLRFQAASVSSTSLAFENPNTTGGCVSATNTGTGLTAMDATCPSGVRFVAVSTFDDSSLTLSATSP